MSEETITPETPPPPAPPAAPAPTPSGDPPPHRWGEMRTELASAQREASEASALVAKLRGQIDTLKGTHKAEIANLTERGDLLRHGITDAPGMAAARAAYGEAGDDRPDTLGGYLDSLMEASTREEEPTALPRWFAMYKTPPAAEEKPSGGVKSIKPPPTPPAANGAVSDDALRTIIASGDRDALAKALATRGVKWQ